MSKIVVGGDISPSGEAEEALVRGDGNVVFGDLCKVIDGADLAIANLECPLVDVASPIAKAGPVLRAGERCVDGLKSAGWDLFSLANNHSYDHGERGLRRTMEVVRCAGLEVVGCGMDVLEARMPFQTERGGARVSVLAMAEREFSVARRNRAGANPLDMLWATGAVRALSKEGAVLVLLHSGLEHYGYPTPEMVRRCRYLIEQGAGAVVCTHAHCPLPWERYMGGVIVYGLGNLVFPFPRVMPRDWHEGYLAVLEFGGAKVGLDVVPYIQCDDGRTVRGMSSGEASEFFEEMARRASVCSDEEALAAMWERKCAEVRAGYLSGMFGYGPRRRRIARWLLPLMHSKDEILHALLHVECETHREVLQELLRIETDGL